MWNGVQEYGEFSRYIMFWNKITIYWIIMPLLEYSPPLYGIYKSSNAEKVQFFSHSLSTYHLFWTTSPAFVAYICEKHLFSSSISYHEISVIVVKGSRNFKIRMSPTRVLLEGKSFMREIKQSFTYYFTRKNKVNKNDGKGVENKTWSKRSRKILFLVGFSFWSSYYFTLSSTISPIFSTFPLKITFFHWVMPMALGNWILVFLVLVEYNKKSRRIT